MVDWTLKELRREKKKWVMECKTKSKINERKINQQQKWNRKKKKKNNDNDKSWQAYTLYSVQCTSISNDVQGFAKSKAKHFKHSSCEFCPWTFDQACTCLQWTGTYCFRFVRFCEMKNDPNNSLHQPNEMKNFKKFPLNILKDLNEIYECLNS